MKLGWQQITARVFSPVLALCAAALVLFVTFSPAQADTDLVMPVEMPEAVALLRQLAEQFEVGRANHRARTTLGQELARLGARDRVADSQAATTPANGNAKEAACA